MLTTIPVFQEGSSEGNLWQCHADEWARMLSGDIDMAKRYVRVSDVLKLLNEINPKFEE